MLVKVLNIFFNTDGVSNNFSRLVEQKQFASCHHWVFCFQINVLLCAKVHTANVCCSGSNIILTFLLTLKSTHLMPWVPIFNTRSLRSTGVCPITHAIYSQVRIMPKIRLAKWIRNELFNLTCKNSCGIQAIWSVWACMMIWLYRSMIVVHWLR